MIEKIILHFPKGQINNCHVLTTDVTIKIVETHAGPCIIDNSSTYENFIVENPNKKEIHFIAIDKCLFDDFSHKKCDCVVFDNLNFCFIEIKDTVNANPSSRKSNKNKAYQQLEEVIARFISVIDFTGYNLEAIVAFKYKPTRPIAAASNITKAFYFLSKYNVDLKEGNSKIFT